ncbi:MAG: PASTA domain-containing protein [Desulfuromonadaceae bacterium]
MIKNILRASIFLSICLMLAACGGGGSSNSQTATVVVPNVVGSIQATAQTTITAAGLTVGSIMQSNSATVPSGSVISQNPLSGISVAIGSLVDLVVSKGPSTAMLKINLSGDLAGKAITGTSFTVTLPANVTPAMVGSAVATSVVTPSGTFAGNTISPVVTYTAAVGATKGTLQIVLPSSLVAGVNTVGEVATVTLQLANGVAPVVADFNPLAAVSATDILLSPIAGISATVVGVTLQ